MAAILLEAPASEPLSLAEAKAFLRVGVLQTFDWATVVPADKAGIALTAIGVASAILRFFTNSAVGAKE
jgi:hypothetical protein